MSSDLLQDVASELDTAFARWSLHVGTLPQFNTLTDPDSKKERVSAIAEDTSVQNINESMANEAEDLPKSPIHPIESLQDEFEESILDSLQQFPERPEKLDAEARRRQLLELTDTTQDLAYSSRWAQRPGQRFHPLRKLVAQISYGIHLLYKDAAIDNLEVVAILQGHVDEVDSFIDDSLDDFDLAIKDISERIHHLTVPLGHSRTFNRMLCERPFRDSILEGNEIIEKIIDRTTRSMGRALKDVETGDEATNQLSMYLDNIEAGFLDGKQDVISVYLAMKDNAIGWKACFKKLEKKGEELSQLMWRLGYIVDEVAKRCGIASRRKTPMGVVGRRSLHPLPEEMAGPSAALPIPAALSRHAEKPLPAPPLRISTNASGIHRPPLSSSPSLQSLDCLYRAPQRPDVETGRPSSSSNSPQSPRLVRFQQFSTSSSPLARTERLEAVGPTPSRTQGSVGRKMRFSSAAEANKKKPIGARFPDTPPLSPGIHSIFNMPKRWTGRKQMLQSKSQENLINISNPRETARKYPQISHPQPIKPSPSPSQSPQIMPNAAASDPQPQGPIRPTRARAPTKKASFSVFPPTTDNRIVTRKSASSSVTTMKLPEQISTSPRAAVVSTSSSVSKSPIHSPRIPISPSDKYLVDDSRPENNYANSVRSDVPTLSHSHNPSSSLATVSTNSSPTPDDPFDALRSHPVTPDMLPHSQKMSITALPRLHSNLASVSTLELPIKPTSPPPLFVEHDSGESKTEKRPVPKQSSLSSLRSMFTRKPSKEGPQSQTRLGPAGIGGNVAIV